MPAPTMTVTCRNGKRLKLIERPNAPTSGAVISPLTGAGKRSELEWTIVKACLCECIAVLTPRALLPHMEEQLYLLCTHQE